MQVKQTNKQTKNSPKYPFSDDTNKKRRERESRENCSQSISKTSSRNMIIEKCMHKCFKKAHCEFIHILGTSAMNVSKLRHLSYKHTHAHIHRIMNNILHHFHIIWLLYEYRNLYLYMVILSTPMHIKRRRGRVTGARMETETTAKR